MLVLLLLSEESDVADIRSVILPNAGVPVTSVVESYIILNCISRINGGLSI